MRHFTYVALLIGCLLLTVPLDRIFRLGVFGRPKRLLLALLPGVLLFGGWDVYAISRHTWSYDQSLMSGVLLPGRLPLEEALFFVVIPIAAILTYQSVLSTLARRPAEPEDGAPAADTPEADAGNPDSATEPWVPAAEGPGVPTEEHTPR